MNERDERVLSDPKQPRFEPAAVSFAWVLASLLIHRRLIAIVGALGFALALLGASLQGRLYTASFSFMPQSGQDQNRSAALAGLAGQLGIAVGGSSQPPQLYADLLSTREILTPIARDTVVLSSSDPRRVSLAEFLDVRGPDQRIVEARTLQVLRTKVIAASAATRTTGVVAVKVTTKSADVSFAIARELLAGLNQFNLATRKSQAGEERRFTEERLAAAKAALRTAEDALQNFLSSNREFGSSAQLTFQRDRLQRDVTLQQQVVMGLSQQYEDARIREVRDTPVITVIEQPILPAMADPRGRVVIVVLGTFGAVVLGCALALMRESWHRQRRGEAGDPSYALLASEWQRMRPRVRKT